MSKQSAHSSKSCTLLHTGTKRLINPEATSEAECQEGCKIKSDQEYIRWFREVEREGEGWDDEDRDN